jgi:general secretion pathway protein G
MTEIPIDAAQTDASSGDEGFTLLELLVVLAILGLLAAIVAPQVLKYLGSSRSQAAKVQIENISAALDHFDLDTGHYPTQEEGGLDALVKAPPNTQNWNGPYLQKPTALIDPWRRRYLYRVPGEHNNDFDVWSYGSDGVAGGANEARDVGNW